jgi:hypothetical protein
MNTCSPAGARWPAYAHGFIVRPGELPHGPRPHARVDGCAHARCAANGPAASLCHRK